jgi:hypothetical protein
LAPISFLAKTPTLGQGCIYITDPVAKQLVVVNSLTGAVTARRNVGYTPSALAWLGITR